MRDLVTNPEYHAIDSARFVEALKTFAPRMSDRDRISLGKLLLDRHKTLHGDKRKVELSGKVKIPLQVMKNYIDEELEK